MQPQYPARAQRQMLLECSIVHPLPLPNRARTAGAATPQRRCLSTSETIENYRIVNARDRTSGAVQKHLEEGD